MPIMCARVCVYIYIYIYITHTHTHTHIYTHTLVYAWNCAYWIFDNLAFGAYAGAMYTFKKYIRSMYLDVLASSALAS